MRKRDSSTSRRSRESKKQTAPSLLSISPRTLSDDDHVASAERTFSHPVKQKPAQEKKTTKQEKQLPGLAIESSAASIQLGYQCQTLRPIVSLAFVFPLILLYELCVIFLGQQELRSGIDQWLDSFLASFGFGQLVILPLLTAAVLIIWHHRNNDFWRIPGSVLVGMIIESTILGLILFSAANACNQMVDDTSTGLMLSISSTICHPHWWAETIASLGSGIYEELVFRLLLLLPAIRLLRLFVGANPFAIVGGIILISLLFSCLHYDVINPAGASFQTGSFVFRFAASVVFCILFLFRGFGIAVGTHVAYDILTQI